MQQYSHFTRIERKRIAFGVKDGVSLRAIARELGRSASSVSREIRRNSDDTGVYSALAAAVRYSVRRVGCRRRLRYENEADLAAFTKKCLDKYWSPEIIAVKWKQAHAGASLSRTTIYNALLSGLLPGYTGEKHLIRHNRLKFKKGNSRTIQNGRSITDRPLIAEKRGRIGDWEGDTMHGAPGKGLLATCVDRRSRYLLADKAKNKLASHMKKVFCRMLRPHKRKTMTLDRGSEFAAYKDIEKELGMRLYFADPHSPWQRGTNENVNGLLRFFFPKGTDFRKVTKRRLDKVVSLINSRPRKCLNWRSAEEVFFAGCCT